MPKTLIVPVDGSDSAERAIDVARVLAERIQHCDVVVMTATGDDAPDRHDYFEALTTRLPAGFRTESIAHANAASAIAAFASTEPDAVVCMTTHGYARLAPLLGSVASEALALVTTPILLVGPHCDGQWWHEPPRVLTGWIGEGSDQILPYAKEWANAIGGELWLETVFHPLDVETATHPEADFASALAQLGSDVDVHLLARADNYPAGAIVRSACELPATLIALTTHDRAGIARSVLGSVAMDVVHRSPCPVLVVRRP